MIKRETFAHDQKVVRTWQRILIYVNGILRSTSEPIAVGQLSSIESVVTRLTCSTFPPRYLPESSCFVSERGGRCCADDGGGVSVLVRYTGGYIPGRTAAALSPAGGGRGPHPCRLKPFTVRHTAPSYADKCAD